MPKKSFVVCHYENIGLGELASLSCFGLKQTESQKYLFKVINIIEIAHKYKVIACCLAIVNSIYPAVAPKINDSKIIL